MEGLDLTPSMADLLEKAVVDLCATIIIISDSNSVFIDHILRFRNLDQYVDKVFTNPAKWLEDGRLEIQPYHHQVWYFFRNALFIRVFCLRNHALFHQRIFARAKF